MKATRTIARIARIAAVAALFAAGAATANTGPDFHLVGGEAKVSIVASDFRAWNDTRTKIDGAELKPFMYRYGSQFRSRPDVLVPMAEGQSLFLMVNPQIQGRFTVKGFPEAEDGYRTFDFITYCKAGAVSIDECAKPMKVNFVRTSKDGQTSTKSTTGYRLEHKLFDQVNISGSTAIVVGTGA